ncbi:MAG: hypothetical protein JRI45_02330 [Deltaproteobacteria bacterium]|nr:hypothetical protein [Deltaproteobacteria bacterium]MBW2068511.1 hypothetical protein [Deltaproteobacteria bacterium]
MRAERWKRLSGILVCLMITTFVWGCATTQRAKSVSENAVQCPAKIVWDVTDAVTVTGFQCFVKPYKGKEMLQYKISFKNVAGKPYRFRVHIIDPEGKSVGGLVPRKGKPPVVQPGKEVSFVYPVPAYTNVPKRLEVSIYELSNK